MATLFLNDLYTIQSKKTDPGKTHLLVQVYINRSHAIFAGHFPGQPVVPGVVMIQMITEILSDSLQEELALKELDRVKFLSLVDPDVHPSLEFELEVNPMEQQFFLFNARILSEDQLIMRCSGKLLRATA